MIKGFIALIAFLNASWAAIVGFIASYVSVKVATVIASISAFIAITLALVIALKALLLGLYMVTPPQFSFAYQFLPSNLVACYAAIVASRVAMWLYKIKLTFIDFHSGKSW